MHQYLRYDPGQIQREPDTIFDFSDTQGIIRAAEQCNGSGDCRKTEITGGTMCPSYMATREEHTTTRARANILREYLSRSPRQNPYNHQEIYDVMDLCLSCKACKSECPSNVDIAKYKAEFLQHYYDSNGIPLRTRLIANIAPLSRLAFVWPAAYHWLTTHPLPSGRMKRTLGIAAERSLPRLAEQRFRLWMRRHLKTSQPAEAFPNGSVYLFADEFTEYNDAHLGSASVLLLNALGYYVNVVPHPQSGRAYLSKGLVRKAARLARRNVEVFQDIISDTSPLIGVEPSAILSFRDEYPQLVGEKLKPAALEMGKHAYLLEEFLLREMKAGKIRKEQFHLEQKTMLLHGHCHQKALASTSPTLEVLAFPENYTVREIPSGCCGLAGSFGYEEEHYQISMRVGELVLFPAIRTAEVETLIVAPGTSCRHQIQDGTGRKAWHPVEVLFAALA
jgi:Fe-S oxidoreductase